MARSGACHHIRGRLWTERLATGAHDLQRRVSTGTGKGQVSQTHPMRILGIVYILISGASDTRPTDEARDPLVVLVRLMSTTGEAVEDGEADAYVR
jgi:hypothetical protein